MRGQTWRSVYFLTFGFRFLLPLFDSYIHPDEHFQTFEPLAGELLGFSTNAPWEFDPANPARSYGVLAMFYSPVILLAQHLGLLPLQTWYLARVQLMLISWVVTDWCLYHMLPTKQERFKAIFFTLTSYVSLVYQCHTFSNSMETILVVLTVYLLNELRFLSALPDEKYKFREVAVLAAAIGVFTAVGVFNRITFPAFFVWPAYQYVKCWYKWKLLAVFTLVPFAAVAYVLIVADTVHFRDLSVWQVVSSPLDWEMYVVTPLNNLVYNSDYSNLAHHGIHPRYTHLLVNLPQLFGPGLAFLCYRFKNRYWNTTPFQAAVSGLVFLSLVPHQELRFLIPIVPLLCCCFDLTTISGSAEKTPAKVSFLLNAWLLFNVLLGLIMGIFHQGGVAPAVDFFHQKLYQESDSLSLDVVQIWWRTYSPPTWMLGDNSSSTQFVTINDDKLQFALDESKQVHVLDTMGLGINHLHDVIALVNATSKIYLITPVASFNQHFQNTPHKRMWREFRHLDMDHIDFTDVRTLQPGLGIFELL